MSRDYFESMAVIPNPTENFNEVWFVVNRANGRFIERMARRLSEVDCGGVKQVLIEDQVFMDSTISYDESLEIDSISVDQDTGEITIGIPNHGFNSGDTVVIGCAGEFDGTYQVAESQEVIDLTFLMHFNDTNGSTNFIDSSGVPTTVNVNEVGGSGLITISTLQSKFGGSSGLFDGGVGSGGYLTANQATVFNIDDNDFTIDLWVNFSSLPSANSYMALLNRGWLYGNTSDNSFVLALKKSFDDTKCTVDFVYTTTSSSFDFEGFTEAADFPGLNPVLGQWYHIAVVRSGADLKIYVDGSQIGTTYNIGTDSIYSSIGKYFTIGCDYSGTGVANDFMDGYIDEVRLVNGTAAWTSNFTPPTSEHSDGTDSFTISRIGGGFLNGLTYAAYQGGGFARLGAVSFDGLDHLEGETVCILADGEVLDQQQVIGGSINLASSYALVHVGLPYNSDMETVSVEA